MKKIFVSHSHKDELFIHFVNNFLIETLKSHFSKDEISFTSDKEQIRGKIPGENNLTLFDEVKESLFFICCISENYINSPFCLLEYATAHTKSCFYPKSIYIFPILSDGFDHKETLQTIQTIQHAKLDNKQSLILLHQALIDVFGKPMLPDKDKYKKDIDRWYRKYLIAKQGVSLKSDKKELINKVVNSLAAGSKGSDIDFPVTIFCTHGEYEELSIKTASKAQHILVWTIYKSPLFVSEAYKSQNYLTKYDQEFEKCLQVSCRYRLVIFEDFKSAEEYLRCDNDSLNSVNSCFSLNNRVTLSQLESRKKAFQKSNNKSLFFTTKDKIIQWYKEVFNKDIPQHFDYEYALLGSSESEHFHFGFTSGFHSNTENDDENLKKHVIIYPRNINSQVNKSIQEKDDYLLYRDISAQIDLTSHLCESSSVLRRMFVIAEEITKSNINILK